LIHGHRAVLEGTSSKLEALDFANFKSSTLTCSKIKFKVSRLYPPNEGSLAVTGKSESRYSAWKVVRDTRRG